MVDTHTQTHAHIEGGTWKSRGLDRARELKEGRRGEKREKKGSVLKVVCANVWLVVRASRYFCFVCDSLPCVATKGQEGKKR